jgi:hypothetical protein
VTCWHGDARRVLTTLVVLVAALPSSRAAGVAAAAPPPPTDTSLLVARLERLEVEVREQARETREARADAQALERRVAELEAEQEDASARRRMQQPAPQPPGNASLVHLHRATVSYANPGAGAHNSDGDGHRRAQQTSCGPMRFMSIQTVCCDEPAEDCSSGAPASCNAGCAAVFLPFMTDCSAALGAAAAQYQPVVVMCRAAALGGGSTVGGSSLAHEFNLVCSGGTVDSCVPACSAALRGDLLLMNLNGDDSKYSCELHHGLHSWVGAATDGGYLGSDAQAFVSAVLSGAAGYYALALTGDAGVATDLIIRPGQDVHITGGGASAPTWGSSSFMVQQGGSLLLNHLTLTEGTLTVNHGLITLQSCAGQLSGLVVTAGSFVSTFSTVNVGAVRLVSCNGPTRAADGTVTNTCASMPEAVWDSGTVHSYQPGGVSYATGSTFALYLLPKTTFNFPGTTDVPLPPARAKYMQLCAAAGLRTVAQNQHSISDCERYHCMTVAPAAGSATGEWIVATTGWHFIVTHGESWPLNNRPYGTAHFTDTLYHPVCQLEH